MPTVGVWMTYAEPAPESGALDAGPDEDEDEQAARPETSARLATRVAARSDEKRSMQGDSLHGARAAALPPRARICTDRAAQGSPVPFASLASRSWNRSHRSGLRAFVRAIACSRRHRAISAWLPPDSTSGTRAPRNSAGRV